jgi:ABC-type transport system involved in cytochrome c biogenesis ATPase subunit
VLHDRVGARAALDRLLGGVRASESQVLVIRGEAGIGKSALLTYVEGRASGYRLGQAAGIEYEMELPRRCRMDCPSADRRAS